MRAQFESTRRRWLMPSWPATSTRAISTFSDELKRNLGEVIALLPLPATEAMLESIALSGSGHNVVIRLVGETDDVRIQTRWKDRHGVPTVIEVSHLSRTERVSEGPESTTQDLPDEAGSGS